jgi:hypothetical protein
VKKGKREGKNERMGEKEKRKRGVSFIQPRKGGGEEGTRVESIKEGRKE